MAEDLDQLNCQKRRIAGGLEHHCVSRDQSRHDLPGGYGQGKVERSNQSHHSYGTANGHAEFVWKLGGGGLSKEPSSFPCCIVCHVYGFLDIASGLREDFSVLHGHEARQLLFPLFKQSGGAVEYLGPLGRRRSAPGVKCLFCAVYGMIHIIHRGLLKQSDRLERCRVNVLKSLARN